MFNEQEYDIKMKYKLLLEQLHDLLGLTTNMGGNLECIISIMKYTPKITKKNFKTAKNNFLILEDLSEQIQALITKAEKISFEHFNIPSAEQLLKEKNDNIYENNIVNFPLEEENNQPLETEKLQDSDSDT